LQNLLETVWQEKEFQTARRSPDLSALLLRVATMTISSLNKGFDAAKVRRLHVSRNFLFPALFWPRAAVGKRVPA
jgi:hypothetical protein